MVLLHNALGKCKTKAPAPLFGGKTWLENLADVLAADPFAGVCHVDQDISFWILDAYMNGTLALHGIQGIF